MPSLDLPGPSLELLHDALTNAYTIPELRKLLRYGLDQKLESIASLSGTGDLTILDVIDHAERHGWTTELIVAGRKRNPGNGRLREAARELVPACSAALELELQLPVLEQHLKRIMLPPLEAAGCYEQSCPVRWNRLPPGSYTLIDYARDLTRGLSQESGGFPLLDFVQLLTLTKTVPSEVNESLRKWLSDTTQALSRDAADLIALRRHLNALRLDPAACRPHPVVAGGAYMLMQVWPRTPPAPSSSGSSPASAAARYGVRAWLLGTDRDHELLDGEEIHTAAEIPGVLDRCRYALAHEYLRPRDVRVEFLLPRDLLVTEVDGYSVSQGNGASVRLGVDQPVVVRSLDRASDEYRRVELLKYQELLRQPQGKINVVQNFKGAAPPGFEALWVTNNMGGSSLNLALTDRLTCCLCLLEAVPAPVIRVAEAQEDQLDSLLRTGIPMAVWLRRVPAALPNGVLGELQPQIHGLPLLELPQQVRRLRTQAEQQRLSLPVPAPWHMGEHLTMLWDNPFNRVPDPDSPDYPFRSPVSYSTP
jgi:hypothetical protein